MPRHARGFDTQAAFAHLCRRDRKLGAWMKRLGPIDADPRWRKPFDPVDALARAILYQQLSGKAAATIVGRVEAAIGSDRFHCDTLARRDDARVVEVDLCQCDGRFGSGDIRLQRLLADFDAALGLVRGHQRGLCLRDPGTGATCAGQCGFTVLLRDQLLLGQRVCPLQGSAGTVTFCRTRLQLRLGFGDVRGGTTTLLG